jgi:hypothetical protein
MPYSKTTDISQLIDLNSDEPIEQKELNDREKIMKSAVNKVKTGGIRETYMYNMNNRNTDFRFEKYERKPEPRIQEYSPPSPPPHIQPYSENFEKNKSSEQIESPYESYIDFNRQGYNKGQKYLSCIDVCNHVNSCPVCSRFYNNDKTVYIIIIVLLSIITVICFKKILNI